MFQVTRDTALFAALSQLNRPAVHGRDRVWTWRDVHMASLALAGRLAGKDLIVNVCESHVAFLVTWLAAVRCGALLVLPGSDKRTHLDHAAEGVEQAAVVFDTPGVLGGCPADWPRLLWMEGGVGPCVTDAELQLPELWTHSRICLYTSGTTGAPQPELKTVDQLIAGAHALGTRINEKFGGTLDQIDCLVSSVATRHMFGVEAVLMLSLIHGIAVLDRRPLLPADVSDALALFPGGAAWITTPLHIRALARANYYLASCRVVVSSTMPLDAATARTVERLVQAPVVEVYGSTETGAIATRRTSSTDEWQLLDGVHVVPDPSGLWVRSGHSALPRRLSDTVQPVTDASFRLVGRSNDLIKVAGHRASLAGLNLTLQRLPGFEESVLHMPASGPPDQRPVLFYVGERLSFPAIKAALDRKMVSVFIPRILIQVEGLPRLYNGKLAFQELDRLYATWLLKKGEAKQLDASLMGA